MFYLVVPLGTERELSRIEEEAKRSGYASALRVVRGAASGAEVWQQRLHVGQGELVTGSPRKLELRGR